MILQYIYFVANKNNETQCCKFLLEVNCDFDMHSIWLTNKSLFTRYSENGLAMGFDKH